jgi:SHS2 domain-containing protein
MAEKEKVKKFEVLSHTADLKIKFYGKDKKDLFKNALLGMQSFLKAKEKESGQSIREIILEADDLESLLFEFLSEINYFNEAKREIFKGVEFEEFSDKSLKGKLFFKKVESFGLIIKGVSYHSLEIKRKKDGSWEGIVLLDT